MRAIGGVVFAAGGDSTLTLRECKAGGMGVATHNQVRPQSKATVAFTVYLLWFELHVII